MAFLRALFSAYLLLMSSAGVAAASEFGPEATKRGKYYVCPDGGAAEGGMFAGTGPGNWSMDWGHGYGLSEISVCGVGKPGGYVDCSRYRLTDDINAKIYVGKAVASYTNQEIDAIRNKFMYSEIVTPSVYVSKEIGYSDWRTRISLENGEGKSMQFVGHGSYGSITDSRGRTFDKRSGGVAKVFCPSGKGYMQKRIVESLILEGASDEFGESKNLPLLIMVTNFYIKKGRPSMENVPSF